MLASPLLKLLNRDQCQAVHHASLEILRRTGVRVCHQGALRLLRESEPHTVDGDRVRFPAALVEWALQLSLIHI